MKFLSAEINPVIPVPAIRPEDIPTNVASKNVLACQVCGYMIDITDKKEQRVVKCKNCNEATVRFCLFSNILFD